MSVNIKRNGALQKIADQTILFDADCAEVRTGTYSIECMSDSGANATITFSTPMPDNDYIVIFKQESPAAGEIGFRTCTTTGFNLFVLGGRYGTAAEAMTFTGTYYAFKLVELEGYSSIYSKVSSPDSTPTQNSTNLCESGGIYDAIKNASNVFIGTADEWDDEENKTDYQLAVITDNLNINTVDSTDGSTTIVANKNLVFKGTLDEWEDLSTAEKKTYDQALITNDMDTGEVVNAVTDGDMRAVTSNAVYDVIAELIANDVEKTFFTPTPSSGSVVAGDCWYIRKGNVVTVNIGIVNMLASTPGEVIFTLPVGLRPCGQRVLHTGNNNNYTAECNIQIMQNGDISVVCNGGCFGTITYVTE